MQALSGTGALWLASQFYLKFLPKGTEVHGTGARLRARARARV